MQNLENLKQEKFNAACIAAWDCDCAGNTGGYNMSAFTDRNGNPHDKWVKDIKDDNVTPELFEKKLNDIKFHY